MDDSEQMMPMDTLVKMINQIASNMAPGRSPIDAANATADHLMHFWARSMKFQLINDTINNVHQLNPIAVKAIEILSRNYGDVDHDLK